MPNEPLGTLLTVVLSLVIIAIVIAVLTLVFRWLWNTTAPEVFGLKRVTFWQALRILLLASILFGGHKVIEVPMEDKTGGDPAAETTMAPRPAP